MRFLACLSLAVSRSSDCLALADLGIDTIDYNMHLKVRQAVRLDTWKQANTLVAAPQEQHSLGHFARVGDVLLMKRRLQYSRIGHARATLCYLLFSFWLQLFYSLEDLLRSSCLRKDAASATCQVCCGFWAFLASDWSSSS